MKKLVSLGIILCMMLICFSARGAELAIDSISAEIDNNDVRVAIQAENNLRWVTLYIYDAEGRVIYLDEDGSGANCTFRFQPDVGSSAVNPYKAVVTLTDRQGNSRRLEEAFFFYNAEEKQQWIRAVLNREASLAEYADRLSVPLNGLYAVLKSPEQIVDWMIELSEGNRTLSQKQFLDIFDRALLFTALKSRSRQAMHYLFTVSADLVDFKTAEREKQWYDAFSPSEMLHVETRMAQSEYNDAAELLQNFKNSTLLVQLSKTHVSLIEQFLKSINGLYIENDAPFTLDFSAYEQLSTNTKREYAVSLLTGKRYDSLGELKLAFDKAIADAENYVLPSDSAGRTGSMGGGASREKNISVSNGTVVNIPKSVFSDLSIVPWAEEAINDFARRGLIDGVGNGKFAPNDLVTREQFVKIAVNGFSLTSETTDSVFTDVPSDSWYSAYVNVCASLGLVLGDEGVFGVGRYITREEMATILYRIVKFKAIPLQTTTQGAFSDADQISEYAREAVMKLCNAGVIQGMGEGCFAPKVNATRAQVVKLIFELSK